MLYSLPTHAPLSLDHWTDDPVPLVFDLDGTLIVEDSSRHLWRSALSGPKKAWLRLAGVRRDAVALSLKDWSLRSVDDLPRALSDIEFHMPIVAHAQAAQAAGRTLWLASGSMHQAATHIAQRLADEHGVSFARVQGSQWPTNFIRHRKAQWLADQSQGHNLGGFDYIGDNPSQDTPVWNVARHGYIVKN